MICLDTNVAVVVMNATAPVVSERLLVEADHGAVLLPTVVVFELRFGIDNSANPLENTRKLDIFLASVPMTLIGFDAEDAGEAGTIRAGLKRKGTPIGPYDVLIAAQARRRAATLVTANMREFSRVPGLRLEDWTAG